MSSDGSKGIPEAKKSNMTEAAKSTKDLRGPGSSTPKLKSSMKSTSQSKSSVRLSENTSKKGVSISTSNNDLSSRRSSTRKKSPKNSSTKITRRKASKKDSRSRSVDRGSGTSHRGLGSEVKRESSKLKAKVAKKDSNYDYGKSSENHIPLSRRESLNDIQKTSIDEKSEGVRDSSAALPAESKASIPLEAILSNVSTHSVQADLPQEESTLESRLMKLSHSSVTTEGTMDDSTAMEAFAHQDNYGYDTIKDMYNSIQDSLRNQQQQKILLTPIVDEFATLWDGLQASHDNEQRLMRLDRDISVKLSGVIAKSRTIIKLARDDFELAIKLGQSLEKAWEKVDEGEIHERDALEKIDNLKQDIFELNRNINSASKVEGQETLRELHGLKKELESQRDELHSESTKYRSSLNVLYAKRQEVFDKKAALEEKGNLLMEEYQAQLEATDRETTRKERLAMETAEIREKIMEKASELSDLERNLSSASNKIIDTEKAVRDQHFVNEAVTREMEFSSNRSEKLHQDFEEQQKLVERLTLDAYRHAQELKSKEQEIYNLRVELHRAMRQRSLNMKKVVLLQQALSTLELEREGLKSKITMLEKELETAQKQIEGKKKKVEQLDKERSFVNRNLKRATAVTTEHSNQAKTHEVAVHTLEQALHLYGLEIKEQQTTIYRLEEERDYYSHEATKLAQQVGFKLNDIKKMDLAILQHKKKLAGLENQVKKLQQIYELARYDKDVFERTLHDTVTDIVGNQKKLRILSNQISSIKYQLNQKDEIIHQEALRYDRILKETDFFKKESQRIQRLAEDIQRNSEALEVERSTLGCAIAEVEGELSRHLYYVNAAQARERLFQRKLMIQEKELRVTWEKWRVLHSMIRIGASHFRSIILEIRDLRFHVLAFRKAQAGKKGLGKNYNRMRHEVAILENCIAKEKCMMGALQEQMRHPINVHRWRLLEATSPDAYEMILKINLLTRRLVSRNSELRDQSKYLEEKQAIYVEARKALARSPSLETPEEVTYYQHLIYAKRRQLQALQRELITAESQTQFYRDEVLGLNNKMLDLKQKFFAKLQGSRTGFKAICYPINRMAKRPVGITEE